MQKLLSVLTIGVLVAIAVLQFASHERLAVADPDPGADREDSDGDAPRLTPAQHRAGVEFFEKKIRPVLVEHCYKCHSDQSPSLKGDLRLDTLGAMLRGGDTGAALVPGKPDDSLLYTALTHEDIFLQMPPKEKLPDEVVEDFYQWIKMGAPYPEERSDNEEPDMRPERPDPGDHWAFQPPVKPDVPRGSSWAQTPVDKFLWEKMREQRLKPVDDAGAEAMLRRIHFDLTGLPPSPDEIAAFREEYEKSERSRLRAIEKVVDELLESPHFGERWGRVWLDVARYAESNGAGPANVTYPHAWRYRNYVIDCFNEDVPYDRFLTEQIAGDLLAGQTSDTAERDRLMIATGFLAFGPKPLNERNAVQFRMDMADEQIDAVTRSTLALTVACARCHDHKFDPIPTRDYYALAGIFLSTNTQYGTQRTLGASNRPDDLIRITTVQENEYIGTQLDAGDLVKLRTRMSEARQELRETLREFRQNRENGQLARKRRQLQVEIARLEGILDSHDAAGNPIAFAMGVQDSRLAINSNIYQRGEVDQPGDRVPRGVPTVLDVELAPIPRRQSGRRQLAQWITADENPLTARVMVNRIWAQLFGHGLVESMDNFGTRGTPPTHPELLDWLAVDFRENGWSIKRMIRQLMLTRAYRLSTSLASADRRTLQTDPDNKWYWRMARRPLTAESMRDAMLDAAGLLDRERPVGSPMTQLGDSRVNLRSTLRIETLAFTSTYRSIYLPVLRDALPDALSLFNIADPTTVTGQRDDTIVPTQALYLLNSPMMEKIARSTAQRLLREGGRRASYQDRIRLAWRLILSREATDDEVERSAKFLQEFARSIRGTIRGPRQIQLATWSAFVQALYCSAEFRYLN